MALKYTITHNGSTWNSTTDVDTISLSNGSSTSSITAAGTRTLNCAGKVASNNLIIGAKTLNCANQIMAGNVVITAQNSFDPSAHNRVGGRIFYIHSASTNSYTFYDINGAVLSTHTVSGLANAYYYDKSGSSVDRFYVYDTINGLKNNVIWGKYGTEIGITDYSIGKGKTNTATALTYSGWEYDSVFTYITTCRNNVLGGCNDWYVGSQYELKALLDSGLVTTWFNNFSILTSTEWSDPDTPYATNSWYFDEEEYEGYWALFEKYELAYVVAMRSF